jgi:Lrp/AsnC family transcriptional regulator for asnA, asnC and gidA
MQTDDEQARPALSGARSEWAGTSGAEPSRLSFDQLDETDKAIIRLLREDGRHSNAEIARQVGTSQPTVRNRIARMTAGGLMKVAAILNPSAHGYACDVVLGIKCQPGSAEVIAGHIAARQYLLYVGYTSGVYDLLVDLLFESDRDLYNFLQSELYRLDGLLSVDVLHVIKAGRVDFDWTVPMGPAHPFRADEP